MTDQNTINFQRIAQAIAFIRENFKSQPSLEQVASQVHLSPFHFQRLFHEWAGVSPKKFMQYTSVQYAKQLLQEKKVSLFDAADQTGLSGTGRLHDLFVTIEGMTPGEFKNGGKNLTINYSLFASPFGKLLVASTHKGICYMAFVQDDKEAIGHLKSRYSDAVWTEKADALQEGALDIFHRDWSKLSQIKLHLQGTAFQLKVWESLLKIPKGALSTYGKIAADIDQPKASRAVGTAIGNNPIAFLIPCHRVIQSSGNLGGYRWGTTRKSAIIGWEAAQIQV